MVSFVRGNPASEGGAVATGHPRLGEAYRDSGQGESLAGQAVQSVPGVQFYHHGPLSDAEQLMLERVNRSRNDPWAAAARFGIGLNDGLPPGTIEGSAKQPLAPNRFLRDAARDHSDWMLREDVFSHTGEGGSSPLERIGAAGYPLSGGWTTGENIAWGGSTGSVDVSAEVLSLHEGLFTSPGHRENICEDDFNEIGIGVSEGSFFSEGRDWNAIMATQNYARSGDSPGPFVTGVVYEEKNGNGLYDAGEGVGDVRITLEGSGFYTETSPSGGYAIPVDGSAGARELTFEGTGWEESSTVTVESDRNVKADLVVEPDAPWYAGADELSDGWRYFDWFKGFKPEGENWIYHGRHGWLYVLADDTSGMFLWDTALGRWLWTSETVYPWMYAYGPEEGWVFFFEGGSPGSRVFRRGSTGELVPEADLAL